MTQLLVDPAWQELDANGVPYAGAKLYSYEAGTSTPLALYSDAALTIPLLNPVEADSAGRFPALYAQAQDYRLVLTTAAGATIWTRDPVPPSTSLNAAFFATADARYLKLDGSNSLTDPSGVETALDTVYARLDGAVFTGTLELSGPPVADDEAATKKYVDDAVQGTGYGRSAVTTTTSGTEFDFTDIPSWANEINILADGVSTDGNDRLLVQIGPASAVETTGYASGSAGSGGNEVGSTSGFIWWRGTNASDAAYGIMTLRRGNADGTIWISSHSSTHSTSSGFGAVGGGSKTLAAQLTQVRVTRSGTNTFDAGALVVEWRA
jgi:hypothetical protein